MKRVYKLPHKDLICNGSCQGLLTNGFGSYYAFAPEMSYQGWYQLEPKQWRMQKIIESITPIDEGECTKLYHQFYGLRKIYTSGAQDTILHYQKALLYSTFNLKGRIKVTLDGRESYDGSDIGRDYEITVNDDFVLIKFVHKDESGKIKNQHYICIKGVRNVEQIKEWKEKHYNFDKERNAKANYWVYEALTFIPRHHVTFSYAKTEHEARTIADIAYFHFDDIMGSLHEQSIRILPQFVNIPDNYLQAAGMSAGWSLQSLYQRFSFDHRIFSGVLAGLPWFFQIWSRDELISLGGLYSIVKRHKDEQLLQDLKRILKRYVKGVTNGSVTNRYPYSELGSIDAIGWLAKRINDFLKLTKSLKQLYTLFTIEELVLWFDTLVGALEDAKKKHMKNGLFFNKSCETWMDTKYQDEGREGYRIEIQALFYTMYDAIISLGKLIDSEKTLIYRKEQHEFRRRVKEKFIRKDFAGLLLDGLDENMHEDRTYRPNVFLAAYIAPDLLLHSQWSKVFEKYLEELYLPWGGVSTINEDNSLFQPTYTGEDNRSYHRGDSWYFVNNIVAMVLYKHNVTKYELQIRKIMIASAKDILEFGFAGHASELSSASVHDGLASLAQAWSSATFVELLDDLFPMDDI